jgi:hypothetical protein
MSLSAKHFGLACGITWGLGVIVLGLLSLFFDYGTEFVLLFGSVYKGYAPTLMGTIIGTVWGFLDGFIGGYIFAWIYNRLLKGK